MLLDSIHGKIVNQFNFTGKERINSEASVGYVPSCTMR